MLAECHRRTVVNELLFMVLQEMGASEVGMVDFYHKKDGTKLTLILLVPVKLLTALVQLKEFIGRIEHLIYLLKVNNRNTRTRCEICSKLTIKTPERRH